MTIRYDLAKVLAEIKKDEQVGKSGKAGEKILSQEEIRARARAARKKPVPAKGAAK